MPHSFRYLPILLIAALALAGCGNKGPLVQPDKVPASTPPAASPQTTPSDSQDQPVLPR